MAKGLLITFEGGEGSGKSTQVKSLLGRLQSRHIPARAVREPGGTPLGDKLRQLLKFSDIPLSPAAELLLFNASRAQLVTQVIRPALERGEVVLCDRFADSTTAYQGYGRGISL
ncbi:MAG: dTMP kinase, partial [Chloroflexi bacterium]|nr:dTMP kinase [Chloroflexota bacterium]